MRACWNQICGGSEPSADIAGDLAIIREAGWEAVELWLHHGDSDVRRAVDDAGLAVAGACSQAGLFFSPDRVETEFQRRLERCATLGAPHLVVVPMPHPESDPPTEADLDRAAENLRAAGEAARQYGVGLEIEFLKEARLVNDLPTALELARRVEHPSVGMMIDTFHLWAGPTKMEDLELLSAHPGRLRFVHLSDSPASRPRELLGGADRGLPRPDGTPLAAMLQAIGASGYTGDVSLEAFDPELHARWAEAPLATAADAYRRVSALLEAV